MNVAIIGSNSFLAEYIIRELLNNNIKSVLYGKYPSPEFSSCQFNVFNFPSSPIDYSQLLAFDSIIYTAGAGVQVNKNETIGNVYELNSFYPIRLSNALASNNYQGKLVTFGSYFEIGNESDRRYYSENEIITALNEISNPYGNSKRLLSRYFSSFTDSPFLYYHLILPNIYGKGENSQRLIPYLINSIKNNEEIKLTNGEQVRQYIYASDIAKTILDIITGYYPKGFYNLCQNEAIKIKELVKKVFVICNCLERFNSSRLFGSKQRSDTAMPFLLLNNEKAQKTFAFQPTITIEEGIKSYLI